MTRNLPRVRGAVWLVVVLMMIGIGCGNGDDNGSPDGGNNPDGTSDAGGDEAANPFEIGCNMARPDLGELTEIAFQAQPDCVMPEGDVITLDKVYVTHLPIDVGSTIYVSGQFTLASVESAGIHMFIQYGDIHDCVGGVASGSSGTFELWGDVGSIVGEAVASISVDFSYETTSTDCRYTLASK